ncbi:MAG: hypothetical protein AAGI53_13985, partial [Planctomycetota bacterium]
MAEERRTGNPTEEELRQLPRWAIVVFAARCAQRVRPLVERGWPDIDRVYSQALDRAITLTLATAADPASVSLEDLRAAFNAANAPTIPAPPAAKPPRAAP